LHFTKRMGLTNCGVVWLTTLVLGNDTQFSVRCISKEVGSQHRFPSSSGQDFLFRGWVCQGLINLRLLMGICGLAFIQHGPWGNPALGASGAL
jgi:hypothetical protein